MADAVRWAHTPLGAAAGLNTVELMKTASSAMGMSPQQAMRCAEGLYTSGYISYPRTESTAYPPGFDFHEVLVEMRRHPIWGEYAAHLMGHGAFAPPKVRQSHEDHLGNDARGDLLSPICEGSLISGTAAHVIEGSHGAQSEELPSLLSSSKFAALQYFAA